MLRLKNLRKSYPVAGTEIEVLKGLNLSFRQNEFVSILGPSGCGKTTTLNIIGGLDKYSDGDLFVGGRSTKEFKDSDWDTYRNDRIGFVFQSYNLIPHQTVIGNVELALAIAGLSKEERIKRAKAALDEVGLTEHYYKRPNQLSGGQCQRVAIARSLVNQPDILLADEPTGALDATTSVQIMELIKEISKDRLVIMVTHNPEIAEKYSTRIIKLIDGQVVDDSNPYSEKDEIKDTQRINKENEKKATPKKAKMSWATSFKLSVRNLSSKRKRTILTSIAGSIGIIGISMVLALSSGVKNYISSMQSDMLSGNPIEITETSYDFSAMMDAMPSDVVEEILKENGYVYVEDMIADLADRFEGMENFQVYNDITYAYIEYLNSMPEDYRAAILYDYGINFKNNIYTEFVGETSTDSMSLSLITEIYTKILQENESISSYASIIVAIDDVINQLPNNTDYILSQYDVVTGSMPTSKDEVVLVLDENSQLSDLTLAQLGYYTQEEFANQIYKSLDEDKFDSSLYKEKFSNEELLNKTFTLYNNNDIYTSTTQSLMSATPFTYNGYESTTAQGVELTVVGILQPKEGMSYGSLSTGMYYTEDLTTYFLSQNMDSDVVSYLDLIGLDSYYSQILMAEYSYTYEGNEVVVSDAYFGTDTSLYSSLMGSSDTPSYYTLSARELGGNDLPESIYIYSTDFDEKDNVLEYLDEWNGSGDITLSSTTLSSTERSEIQYTDNLSLIIFIINNFINIVTIALIAFTSLALVVSCVMIAIITYVSILERVKEIGVIRSLGGRKKDVTRLFNVENLLIGLCSGTIGVLITYGISLLVNTIVYNLAGISGIAALPINEAIIMILISTLLTIFSGLIPSRNAAKQDPVKALRSE